MTNPTDQTVDNLLTRLTEWRKYYEELAELQAQFTELQAAADRLENNQTADAQLSRDVRRMQHVLKYRIAELKEKLADI